MRWCEEAKCSVAVSVAVPNSQKLSPYSEQGVTTETQAVASLSLDRDARAVARTLHGDVNAFNELVLRYQKLAFGVAYRLLPSRETAEDVVQESFLKAFRSLPAFRSGSFRSWLLRIVVNTCYDHHRRANNRAHASIGDEDRDDGIYSSDQWVAPQESLQAYVERMELNAQLELGIRNLPHEQRTVVVLCDIHGCSYAEIHEITGIDMGTIKSRLSRARARLRDILLGLEYSPE